MFFMSQTHIDQDTYGPVLSVQMHLGIEHFMQVVVVVVIAWGINRVFVAHSLASERG